ncbi:major facilitator superfamily domain-containing protein [Aspergillus pseudocaelatus]|uniref:Major facilitator superfamily domain-containing protein n=1 Tax=Aspergillus pseudocaelatus TaxID=1825620 RepID=A0ABQ6W0G5_9EURO|nr:major facilitator superfamily domain-containing protein [Aspergillus pseudocaelatus]
MQSLRQYRCIDRSVQNRILQDTEKKFPRGDFPDALNDSSSDPSLTEKTSAIIPVQWDASDCYLNPRQYSVRRKAAITAIVAIIAIAVTASSAIDAAGAAEYQAYFGVSDVVASLPTGFGLGSLISGPFSETFGRSIVYIVTLIIFLLLIMASALAPNLASHLVFRFTAGVFAATPLTCAGGTVSDLWDPLQKTYGFPIYAIPAFTGPMIGQVIGSYIPSTLGWRWLEWIMLITGGIVLVTVALLQKETYQDVLLQWKAIALRKRTGNQYYKGPMELRSLSLRQRLVLAIYRPFIWGLTEPIVILMSLYLTAVYIILFLFLEGYQFIFKDIYHFSEGQTNVVWMAMVVGTVSTAIQVPVVWIWTKREYKQAGRVRPESRLWFAMLGGAISIPVSLFWLAWTSSPSITVWSPICATALFGFGITTVFISTHMYVIDSYEKYSASALAMLVLSRYLAAGGMTIAGNPIYSKFGVPYTLSTLGAISAVMAIIPYLFYIHGQRIRNASKHAVVRD